MTYIKHQLRSGATAIAAALALSSTPLLAQAGAQPAPTLPTPAPPISSAPVPTLPTPAAPTTVRSAAPEAVTAAPERRTEQRAAATTRNRAPVVVTRSVQATTSAAPAPINADPAPAAQAAEPIATAPAVPLAEAVPNVESSAVPSEPAAAAEGGVDLLPIAGGAAGLLVLAGGAYALTRRRRDADDGYVAETWEQDHVAYAEPDVAPEPVAAAEPVWRGPDPYLAPAPAMAQAGQVDPYLPAVAAAGIPAGMDLSRYGRHVQAAYRGPTSDNPSLSLKRRLKRAAFFDQRERMASEASDMPQPVAQAEPVPAAAARRDTMVTSQRVSAKAGTQALFGFRPAFQN